MEMKPDRITKLVEKAFNGDGDEPSRKRIEQTVIQLLRREQARVRRIVKAELARTWAGDTITGKAMNIAHRDACHSILAALKGKP